MLTVNKNNCIYETVSFSLNDIQVLPEHSSSTVPKSDSNTLSNTTIEYSGNFNFFFVYITQSLFTVHILRVRWMWPWMRRMLQCFWKDQNQKLYCLKEETMNLFFIYKILKTMFHFKFTYFTANQRSYFSDKENK